MTTDTLIATLALIGTFGAIAFMLAVAVVFNAEDDRNGLRGWRSRIAAAIGAVTIGCLIGAIIIAIAD